MAHDAANELTEWGVATPVYDANGNTLSDGTNSYAWNGRNQLASMNMGAASFQYDPLGRRVAKTIFPAATTNYLYDGANPVQELSGTTPTANLLTGGLDEYFQRTDSSGTANFLTDALGSTLALTDPSGNTLASYAYEPFGNTTTTGSSASTYQFTGRENDGIGVYFYRARYYSPLSQRFVSEDPIGLKGGINFYRFVGDNPVSRIDPFGLWTASVGGSVSIQWGPIAFQYTGGFAIDSHGNIAVTNTGGGGAGVGGQGSLGVNVGISNAPNVCGLGGPFYNVGAGAGLGPDAGVNQFGGFYNGKPVVGVGVTGGAGAGAGVSDTLTGTVVTPIAGRKDSCP